MADDESAGTAQQGQDVPEGAIPLFIDNFGATAYIRNVSNPNLPSSVSKSSETPVYKSAREHRHIRTMAEARAFAKMDHPSERFEGSARSDLGSIEKSMSDTAYGGPRTVVNWHKESGTTSIMKRDWEDFERFRRH